MDIEGLEVFGPIIKFGLLPETIPLFSIRSQKATLVYEEEQNESLPKHQETGLLGSLLQIYAKGSGFYHKLCANSVVFFWL